MALSSNMDLSMTLSTPFPVAASTTLMIMASSTPLVSVRFCGSDFTADENGLGLTNDAGIRNTECRDTGKYGFVQPPEAIVPAGKEMTAGFIAMAQAIKKIEGL
jgi:hypothetical protein